ncbi:MAG: hypothetical protein ACTHMD_10965 [Flavisolibacter sp.]
MSFTILPYLLDTCLEQMKEKLTFHSVLDGVHYYDIKPEHRLSILELSTSSISLYFFENRLISVYYRMEKSIRECNQVVALFKKQFHQKPFYQKLEGEVIYGWKDENEFVGILNSKHPSGITVYHTLDQYNVFDEKF